MLPVSLLEALPPGFLSRDATVVDVGAHEGDWSEAVRRLASPSRMILIEPSPDAFGRLEDRFGDDARVALHCCAAGVEAGEAQLRVMSSSDFNSLLPAGRNIGQLYPGLALRDCIPVPVRPLDDLLAEVGDVRLLKIDVQGAERRVLGGATSVLRRTAALQLEVNFRHHYDGDSLFCELDAAMRAAGFALHHLGNLHQGPDVALLWGDAVYLRA
jgi:FkbM family methyltransferase